MDTSTRTYPELFMQLGLDNNLLEIERFIATHSPLDNDVKLVDAPFWSASQRAFLKENYLADSDWILIIDQLNKALHEPKK
ncbi:DUF2789 domain-containing protein [Pseudomonas cremoricolorata]|uniref:DUF2789 domain-containing protein n=1 Tax=Pseudomonas cremoricolorata TaxID=157783 RepID=A0A089WK87_9PSED|nr:DUF2789 domain-containing protein [Pseudomonas cremoricolorata]AIR89021.1 hypothetical protein LK03_06940 [Pseudomonas cremoricolorata]